jgi:hypothetical protein
VLVANNALNYNTTTHAFSCATISAGTGTVTSVAQTMPSVFSVTGSPVTTSGTLAVTFATGQTQNQVLASPNGSSAQVGLRALVGADIPAINLGSSERRRHGKSTRCQSEQRHVCQLFDVLARRWHVGRPFAAPSRTRRAPSG